eukprot:1153552-Pelagomonas_calceolata.AAC.2
MGFWLHAAPGKQVCAHIAQNGHGASIKFPPSRLGETRGCSLAEWAYPSWQRKASNNVNGTIC